MLSFKHGLSESVLNTSLSLSKFYVKALKLFFFLNEISVASKVAPMMVILIVLSLN